MPTWEVTGITTSGKRFKIVTTNMRHAFGINLYRGSVWQRNEDGTRTLLKREWN